MVREGDFVAVFHSIHRVMKAEKVLKAEGLQVLLIPVPRQLSSDCGLALRFGPDERERIEAVLQQEGLPVVELYQRQGEAFSRL